MLLLSVFSMMIVAASVLVPTLGIVSVQAKSSTNTSTHSENFVKKYDIIKNCATDQHTVLNPQTYLTHFSCGHVSVLDNGTTVRKFSLVVEENHKIPITMPDENGSSIKFPAWTFNSSIPGPTMRMTEGDHISITVINRGTMPHSLHMHSIHQGLADGVPMFSGQSGIIPAGKLFTYNFIASPFGLLPYHCHLSPVVEHVNRGLYGAMIIDPAKHRPIAKEMVFFMNGYDLNINDPYPRLPTVAEANQLMVNSSAVDLPEEHDNSVYSMNGVAFYYVKHPINLTTGQLYRAYVVNMLDFEPNSIHMHGNLYDYYPSGTSSTPAFRNDIVSFA